MRGRGRLEQLLASPPPSSSEVAGALHNPCGLAAFPGERSPRKGWAPHLSRPDCLRPAPVGGPLPRGLAGRPVLALPLPCSVLSKNWFCKGPSLFFVFYHSHFDFCLSKKVVALFRQVQGEASLGIGLTQSQGGRCTSLPLGFCPCDPGCQLY